MWISPPSLKFASAAAVLKNDRLLIPAGTSIRLSNPVFGLASSMDVYGYNFSMEKFT
jgi:hypothetical protein